MLVRSQELPLFARLGPHRRDLHPGDGRRTASCSSTGATRRRSSPSSTTRCFRWHDGRRSWGDGRRPASSGSQRDRPGYVEAVLERGRRADGPLAAGELATAGRREGPWWDWDDGKLALEYLFWTGRARGPAAAATSSASTTSPSGVVPAEVLALPDADRARGAA